MNFIFGIVLATIFVTAGRFIPNDMAAAILNGVGISCAYLFGCCNGEDE